MWYPAPKAEHVNVAELFVTCMKNGGLDRNDNCLEFSWTLFVAFPANKESLFFLEIKVCYR